MVEARAHQPRNHRLLVVGAILVDSLSNPTKILAARRSRPSHLAGQWEFPGGKVEQGESPQDALVRELREELGITVEIGDELPHPDGAWPIDATYELRLFFARILDGEPRPDDSHDQIQWLTAAELTGIDWLPSDRAAIPAVTAKLTPR